MKTIIGVLLTVCLLSGRAFGDLTLLLTPQGSTTIPIGGTLDVDVEVVETTTSILTTDGIFAGAVLFNFDVPGIARLETATAGPGFDNFSDVNATPELVVEATDFNALPASNPLSLGTITVLAAMLGTTTISTADPNPGATFVDFLSGRPEALDDLIFETTARLTITVVPEPTAAGLLMLTGVAFFRRRRR